MPRAAKASAPLTFDLPESLVTKIEQARKGHGFGTASDVVRLAVKRFDYDGFTPKRDPHVQISVRISTDTRAALRRTARVKDTSIGELLRVALEALPTRPNRKRR